MRFLRTYYSQLLFLLIGILIGFFISRLPIKFEEKTSWISLATFVLTIVLAIYLEFIVRPSFTNTRSEKDILIDQLKEIKTKLSEINSLYAAVRSQNPLTKENKDEMIGKLRELSNQIELLKQTDEYCKTFLKSEISIRLFGAYMDYKKSLTGDKFNKVTFFYDRLYWKTHEKIYQEMMKICMHCIIDINKSR